MTLPDTLPALTEIEADNLAHHEATIRAGLDTFVEVGQALAAIRDGRLYRTTHGTFEDYCGARWKLSVRRAYEFIASAEVVEHVRAIAHTPEPVNEAQARPLTKLRDDPDAVRSAWSRATDQAEAEQKPVTAAIVQQAVHDELAARRGEIEAAQAEHQRSREAIAEFNAATAHLVPQMEAERPWVLAAIAVTRAVERLPLDVDPDELATRVPSESAYRLDSLHAAIDWLARLSTARKATAS